MYIKLLLICALALTALDASYTLQESRRMTSKIDRMPKNKIADMTAIPQNPAFYASQIKAFSLSKQKSLDKKYNKKYFKPWALSKLDIPSKDYGWEVRFVTRKPIYKAWGSVIGASTYNQWISNANYDALDSKGYKAITIRRTNVKALPTISAFYRNPSKTGEGFPFDYNQNSALHINVPLYVSHFSKDNKWAFVRASYAFGWVKTADLALVDAKFIKLFKNNRYAITIKDNLRLFNNKKSVSLVKLGAVFPISRDKKHYLIASRTSKGHAKIQKVSVLGKRQIIASKPLRFNQTNVAKVAKEFYNEPYGWGGSYECRDCSATTRDFLGVFGIFLRRNSSKQALDGTRTYIKGLSKVAKKKKIIKYAKPFASLLHVPGHIVLYLGQFKGEPVIMHTYWGLRKNNRSKLVTGRTIITTLEAGKERSDIREKSMLIHTLKNIINF